MTLLDRFRGTFDGLDFGPPCTPEEIDEAEWTLGLALPPALVELYASFDGFEGPAGTSFLYPLIRPRPFAMTTLVEQTLVLRHAGNLPEWFPRAVVFGDYGCGPCWGMTLDDPVEVFEWHPGAGPDRRVLGDDPLAVWLEEKGRFDDLR